MPRTINDAALDLIKQSEGCRLVAYQDVAGIWTIGYGHINGVTPGMVMTQAQADQALIGDLLTAKTTVDDATRDVFTSDNQFGAMVSLCFNIGSANYRDSTVLRQHRSGNFPAAAQAFLLWDKARVDGQLQEVGGLLARRQAESTLYRSA
jgi:lysozyme